VSGETLNLNGGTFRGRDGAELAYQELGSGRPLVLLHGFTCSVRMHWIEPGHAQRFAELGYRVVMPELRGHGESAAPRDAAGYPKDIFVDDLLALIEQLELTDYDLGGYSLGGRSALRATIRGATPGRLVVAGMGMEGMVEANGPRNDLYRRTFAGFGTFSTDEREGRVEAFLRSTGADPESLAHGLEASVDSSEEEIRAVAVPTLVAVGAEDSFHRQTAALLAQTLQDGRFQVVAGAHDSAAEGADLGAAIAAFLGPADADSEGRRIEASRG
jgi:pimeloyl-ACP methyl ester carboxylesterase